MRMLVNVALILIVGVSLGMTIRALRPAKGPGPDDVVYTNESPLLEVDDFSGIENPEPAKPPEGEAWLSRFELTERSGETIRSEDLVGEPYVVSFFFSTCPSICVQQNQKIKELQDEFEGQGVRFVAISVDPETDTPEQLREYAARFGADPEQWLFMTGDLTYIRRIGAEIFQQPVDQKFHTERFVLVDPSGEIEGFYTWSEPVQLDRLKKTISGMIEGEG
ncbi:MAG: SCO family protein [Planctomycetota bacterium]|nr:SCO family protein [Planctomycetota bacterium]